MEREREAGSLLSGIPNEELDKDANDWYYIKQMFMGLIGLGEIVGVICYFENVAKATKNETLL